MIRFKYCILLLFPTFCFCQLKVKDISLNGNGKLIEYISSGVSLEAIFLGDLDSVKPLIVFIQGSEPRPLFACQNDNMYYPLFPEEIIGRKKENNYVLLSKPGIPAVSNLNLLNKNYLFLDSISNLAPPKYTNNNCLEFYTQAYIDLLNILNSISKNKEIILIGHSQGARIVAELSGNSKISKIVYMSADPLGRIAINYDTEYSKFKNRNEEKLLFYDQILNPDFTDSILNGETYKSWKSFSKPSIAQIINCNKPVLIVYGEFDENCPNCYVFSNLPFYFKNINVKKYSKLDHNFFNDKRIKNWDTISEDVYNWIKLKN